MKFSLDAFLRILWGFVLPMRRRTKTVRPKSIPNVYEAIPPLISLTTINFDSINIISRGEVPISRINKMKNKQNPILATYSINILGHKHVSLFDMLRYCPLVSSIIQRMQQTPQRHGSIIDVRTKATACMVDRKLKIEVTQAIS